MFTLLLLLNVSNLKGQSSKKMTIGVDKLLYVHVSTGGSVVEYWPATRAARVRFPADAHVFLFHLYCSHVHYMYVV